ncbi:MAG TPA: SLC13 family permease [Rhodospirillales bacterium]|nr:SLC13 family permease [Rhodospirillales bacterium]HIM77654.1 SLC13 family permease [Rhodospirillales bacterium]
MWAVFAFILVGLVFYVFERAAMEVTSLGIICALLIFFHFFPVIHDGVPALTPGRILQGFANPALITVLALLVMGQGMVRTGVLDRGANLLLGVGGGSLTVSLLLILVAAMAVSAFLNNIPVVVIFIPIMQALAHRYGRSASKLMIPLSYGSVLGGMTTLIGSSTNLLVNSALIEVKATPFGFFDFTIPGLVMASVGLIYVLLVAPRLLPDRSGMADSIVDGDGKHFVAQITVTAESKLVGKGAPGGHFSVLPDKTLRMVQRGEQAILPPFEDFTVRPGDILVVSATRKALGNFLAEDPGLLYPDLEEDRDVPGQVTSGGRWLEGGQALAEVMVAPASGLAGLTLPQIGFRYKTHCIVLGLQRRSRMVRERITGIRLRAGDVLLVQGQPDDIAALKRFRDVVLLEWSAEELPVLDHAKRATLIFITVLALAASGVVPIVVAALTGAAAMVVVGVLNVRQAFQAVDPKIVTTIGAALALGVTLQETGGARYIAQGLLTTLWDAGPATILSLFFLLVAGLSNIISTKTAAVLFTPIAVDLAVAVGVEPQVFAVAVVFAANCSFASPLGYQTNLLVMGPGHYKFIDFVRAGTPLIVLMWIVFSLFAPWYYGI